ncbi:MAG: hypothetical protein OEQ49_06390 [Myxococcales bacterium]|nr:hypothetical protein [Myxococcales bacterium]
MKTYPIIDDVGSLRGFEIAVPLSYRPIYRALRSVEGVTDVKRTWFNEDRMKFKFNGEPFIVWEPYGDNSRYWIGPADPPSEQDISPIHEAFERYRYSAMLRLVLWLTVIVLVALWCNLTTSERVERRANPLSDGRTYLALDHNSDGRRIGFRAEIGAAGAMLNWEF